MKYFHFKYLCIGIIPLLLFTRPVIAQETEAETEEYCNPRVEGMARPVGLQIKYERVMDYLINSTSNMESLPDGESEVQRNRRISGKVRIPVINKDNFKLTYGFSYAHEEFRFDDPEELIHPLYKALEDKSLKSLGSSFNFLFPSRNKTFLAVRVNLNLNGDYYRDDVNLFDYLKVSAGPVFGWKRNSRLTYGIGFAYTYTFGDPGLAPIIAYYHTFNNKWGIEALLPLEAKARYTYNYKNLIYLGANTRGASYNIKLGQPEFEDLNSLELRHSEIKFFASWHKEIYDFIWIAIEAGYRYNLNFNLAEKNRNRNPAHFFKRDYLVVSDVKDAAYFNFSLNIKPPRKLYNNKN